MATITMAPAPPAEIPMMATSERATEGGGRGGRGGGRNGGKQVNGQWRVRRVPCYHLRVSFSVVTR